MRAIDGGGGVPLTPGEQTGPRIVRSLRRT
jgi:hypothetical protein